jgi:NAD(P)-dependent dehydrogenase (short-subunit alcohol dehydrogenase family)
MVADYGAEGMSLYGSSKAAINLLTKAWAAEYGPKGVRVNAVSPGPTRTEGTAATRWNSSRRKRPPGDRPRLRRLPRRSCSWRPTAPVSSRARFCRSMAVEQPYRFRCSRSLAQLLAPIRARRISQAEPGSRAPARPVSAFSSIRLCGRIDAIAGPAYGSAAHGIQRG